MLIYAADEFRSSHHIVMASLADILTLSMFDIYCQRCSAISRRKWKLSQILAGFIYLPVSELMPRRFAAR